jgi:hypothetical protein
MNYAREVFAEIGLNQNNKGLSKVFPTATIKEGDKRRWMNRLIKYTKIQNNYEINLT